MIGVIDGNVLSGRLDDEAAIADMAARFEALTGLWLATRGRKAA